MGIWIYPGSFDPVTLGHLDIIERASHLCDTLVVAVLNNSAKRATFPVEQKLDFLRRSTAHLPNVRCESFGGLLVDYARAQKADAIVRGLRAVSDFEMEFQLATMNRRLAPQVETVFIMTSTEYSFVSSSIVREVGRYGGDISGLVPPAIHEEVKDALATKRSE